MSIPESAANQKLRLIKEAGLNPGTLKTHFLYDPLTGHFTCLTGLRVGKRAGSLTKRGYWQLIFRGKNYAAHRLAWLYMTGEWPTGQLDHRDNNRSNNAWANLRVATNSQNNANRSANPKRKGLKGVTQLKNGKWRAQLMKDYRIVYAETFNCPAAAHFAYILIASRLFGEFARAS